MTGFDYARTAATALRLLTRFGQPMMLRRVTTGDYSEGAAPQTPANVSVTGVIADYSDYEAQNELVEANDRKATIAAMNAPLPTVADQLVIGAVAHKIIRVKALNPGGTPVVYDLQVRQ